MAGRALQACGQRRRTISCGANAERASSAWTEAAWRENAPVSRKAGSAGGGGWGASAGEPSSPPRTQTGSSQRVLITLGQALCGWLEN